MTDKTKQIQEFDKKEALENLNLVVNDCRVVMDYLDDLSTERPWDLFDRDNWDNFLELLTPVIKYLEEEK